MRAAVLTEYTTPPGVADRDEPVDGDGRAIVQLLAAGLNPADLAIASGKFPAGNPPLPYIPGIEGVGTVVSSRRFGAGTRVWACGRGLGVASDGTFAERFSAADEVLIEVPDGIGDELAAGLGVVGLAAWMPLSWLAPVQAGESVLVLGASGAVGSVAVQAAKVLGAGHVVGAGRDEARLQRATKLGADAVVELDGGDYQARLAESFDGAPPPTLVFDALWGAAVEAAAAVAGPGARIVHIGQSAGPAATLASAHVRGKQLQILGYSNFTVPQDALAQGYGELLGHAAEGRISIETKAFSLERIAEAWSLQRRGPDAKLVVVP